MLTLWVDIGRHRRRIGAGDRSSPVQACCGNGCPPGYKRQRTLIAGRYVEWVIDRPGYPSDRVRITKIGRRALAAAAAKEPITYRRDDDRYIVYLGDERKGAWKIDIWTSSRANFELVKRYGDRILERLTPETREAILAVKAACWQHPDYRRGFSSSDIYAAVLDHGVKDAERFWLHRRRFNQ